MLYVVIEHDFMKWAFYSVACINQQHIILHYASIIKRDTKKHM